MRNLVVRSVDSLAILMLVMISVPLSAQVGQAEHPVPAPMPAVEMVDSESQATPVEPRVEREIEVLTRPAAPGHVQTFADVNGLNGDLVLDSPPSPFHTGVWLRARTATPDVFAQLGTSTSASSFQIVGSNEIWLFKVRGDGYATLRRDQDGTTGLEINNANPGTASTSSSRALRLFEGGSLKATIASMGSGSTNATGGANALWVWNYANGPIVFGANGNDRMRIYASGKVSIGYGSASEPSGRFSVLDNSVGGHGALAEKNTVIGANTAQDEYAQRTRAYQNPASGISNSGKLYGVYSEAFNVGTGHIAATFGVRAFSGINVATGSVADAYGVHATVASELGTVTNGYGVYIENTTATNDYGLYQAGANDTNYLAGNVIIGPANPVAPYATLLDVRGNVNVAGSLTGATVIGAVYQDVAEWVPATVDMEPGTVVVLNHDRTNEVMPSHTSYDTSVAGVVSAQPGVLLGVAGDSKEQIATTGRVKVRVDATRAPIRVGDLLVTSDVSGTAMRSEPMDIHGRRFHQPGTIIGKALEPLESGTGEILVLLSMQ